MLLHRALKSRLPQVAPLTAACDLLFPTLGISRNKHSDTTKEASDQAVTSRTKRDNKIRFFVINNRPNEALDLLERTLFRTPIIDPQTNKARYLKLPPASVCNKVLDSVSQVEDDPDLIIRAADLAGALQLEGVGIEARTAQSLIHGLAHVGMVDKGIELLDGWMNANVEILEDDEVVQDGPAHVMATLLEAAAHADDTDAITQVLLRMARVGLSPAPHSMTTLLQCFTRLGNVTTAHSMLQWMRRSGIEPQAVHYAALMTMPAATMTPPAAGKFLLKAKEAYRDMKSHYVQPSAYFYAAYINVCSHLRDLEAARDAWLDMEQTESVQPDLVCYTTMIDACAKGGDIEGAFHLYEEMQKNGIKPDAVVFATLISAVSASSFGREDDEDTKENKAQEIWNDMKKAGITPDIRTISVYLNALLRGGESHAVLNLLQQEGSGKKLSGAVAGLYEHALSFAAERVDVQLLKSLSNQMKALNIPFTTHAVTSLLAARARQLRHKRKLESTPLWHVALDMDSSAAGGGKYKALHLGNSTINIIDRLIDAVEKQQAKQVFANTIVEQTSSDFLAILIGWHSVEGSMEQAIELYTANCEHMERNVRIWTLKMLLAGAMATEDQQQRVALILKVVGAARTFSKSPTSGGWWWDQRTQKMIETQLRKAPEAIGLVSDGEIPVGDVKSYPRRLVKRPL